MANGKGSPSRKDMSTLLVKHAPFRWREKLKPVIKGSSKLNIHEISKYDIKAMHDMTAKPSKKMEKSNIEIEGDGEVWVEKIYRHSKTRQSKIFFVSKQTGRKVPDEPPSGASHVIYLRQSFIEERTYRDPTSHTSDGKYSKKQENPLSPSRTPADMYALHHSGGEQKQLARLKPGYGTPSSKVDDQTTIAISVATSPPNGTRMGVSFLEGKYHGDFNFSDCDGFYNERPKLVKEKGNKDFSKDLANILEEQ